MVGHRHVLRSPSYEHQGIRKEGDVRHLVESGGQFSGPRQPLEFSSRNASRPLLVRGRAAVSRKDVSRLAFRLIASAANEAAPRRGFLIPYRPTSKKEGSRRRGGLVFGRQDDGCESTNTSGRGSQVGLRELPPDCCGRQHVVVGDWHQGCSRTEVRPDLIAPQDSGGDCRKLIERQSRTKTIRQLAWVHCTQWSGREHLPGQDTGLGGRTRRPEHSGPTPLTGCWSPREPQQEPRRDEGARSHRRLPFRPRDRGPFRLAPVCFHIPAHPASLFPQMEDDRTGARRLKSPLPLRRPTGPACAIVSVDRVDPLRVVLLRPRIYRGSRGGGSDPGPGGRRFA